MDNKYKELGINTVIFGASLFLSKLVSSFLIPVYTRTLTTEQYGIADLITTLSGFIVPICSLSIYEAVFRFSLDRGTDKTQILRCGINISWMASILIYIVGQMLKLYKPVSQWAIFLVLVSIFTMIRNILSLYTKANDHILLFGIDTIVYNFILGITNILFLVIFSLGLPGYFGASIVSLIISILFLSITERVSLFPNFKKKDKKIIVPMLRYSVPLIVNSISWILMNLIDRIMLTSLYTSSSNGIYAIASKIPTLVTVIASVFNQAWGISIVKDYDSNKDEKFYNNIFGLFNVVIFFGTSTVLLFTNNIIKFIIGSEFSESIKYIGILMIGTVFLAYTSFFSSIYLAVKKSAKIAISSFVGAILNIILNTLLIPVIGIMGACIATSGSYMLIAIYRMIDCKKYINFIFDKRKFIISIILLFIQCIFITIDICDVMVSIFVEIEILFIYKEYIKRFLKLVIIKISNMRKN